LVSVNCYPKLLFLRKIFERPLCKTIGVLLFKSSNRNALFQSDLYQLNFELSAQNLQFFHALEKLISQDFEAVSLIDLK